MVVKNLIKKTNSIAENYKDLLGDDEQVLSHNKVTGHSLNFPIAGTCRPTKVCIKTCYYAVGASSWDAALRKQLRTLNAFKVAPKKMARKVIREYDNNRCTYLRWNGGGDLFPEAVQAINYISKIRPDIVLWIVTRRLDMAALIKHDNNKHIHISLDRTSVMNYWIWMDMEKLSTNYFFSYQMSKKEKVNKEVLKMIDVLFFDSYIETRQFHTIPDTVHCELTTGRKEGSIDGSCSRCRKCFDVSKRKID